MHLQETPRLVQPRDQRAKVSLWADLTVSDMDVLEELNTPEALKGELAQLFHLEDYRENMKNAVLLDLYYYTLQFARDNHFTKEQTSAFFSIVKQTHEMAIETPFGNVEHCFRFFREMVLCHAVKRPPFSIDLYTADHVRKITDYVINTYFRHFKMYKYVFTPLVRLDLSMTYPGVPPTPEPSEAGDGEGEQTGREGETAEGALDGEGQGQEDQEAQTETKPGEDESTPASELRQLIRQHLSEELSKLKEDMESQLSETDKAISEKLQAAEAAAGSSGTKTPRASGRSKKK